MNLDEEALLATGLLAGRTVRVVRRHGANELLVEFTDGTRLFVDGKADSSIELSITEA